MSKSNFEIAFQLGANMDPSVKKAFGDTQKRLGNMSKSIGNVVKNGAKMAAGFAVAGAAVGGAAVAMANKFADTADTIDKTAMKMGVSTDAYQELEYALGQVGVEQETMEKSVGRLNQRLGNTSDNKKYRSAIQDLGIATEDASGKTRNADDVFMDSVQALHEMEDSTKQAAAAQEIFGTKTSRELMPAIVAGGDAISNLRGEAQDLDIVIGKDGVKAGVLWADTMDKAKNMMGGFFNTIASQALPILQKFLEYGISKMPVIQEKISSAMSIAGDVLSWVGETGMRVFNSIRDAIGENFEPTKSFGERAQEVGEFLKSAFEKAQPYIEWFITDGIPKAIEIIANMTEKAKEVYNFIADNWNLIGPVVYGIVGALTAYKVISTSLAAAVAIKTAAVAAFGVAATIAQAPLFPWILAIGLLVAAGVALYKNWDTVSAFAITIWGGIRDFFSGIFSGIGDGIINLKDGFIGGFKSMLSGIKGPVNGILGLANGIIGGYENMINGISRAINKIPSFEVPSWVPGIGGSSFGLPNIPSVSLPRIPALAEGGITSGATLAMIGEGAEQEAVMPLSKLQKFLDMPDKNDKKDKDSQSDSPNIYFNPTFVVEGDADESIIQKVTQMSFREFKKMLDKYFRDKDRKEF